LSTYLIFCPGIWVAGWLLLAVEKRKSWIFIEVLQRSLKLEGKK